MDGRGSERLVLVVMLAAGDREFELVAPKLTIGRSSSGHVVIEHPSVSRAHAEIAVANGRAVVRDLGSRNGTSVNGERLGTEGVTLRDEDVLAFGDIRGYVMARVSDVGVTAKVLESPAFEKRLAKETDRCVRDHRSLTVFALESFSAMSRNDVGKLVATSLRSNAAARVQPSGRIDVLAPGCDRERAALLASRLVEELAAAGVNVRIGLATFPGDVPSASSLFAAADATLAEVTLGGYGSARWTARHITIGSREIVLVDPSMIQLFGVIERLSTDSAPVLVRGETGSGKEIVAEAIHLLSARASRPLVRVNCAAMAPALVESELFGHVRGAFSGADRDKVGLFEEANGGTLFLDEIGEFELPLQAKLLRVLEDRRIRRVGGTEIAVDVRIIAATHRDLKAAALAGTFREDLYYRLSAMVLQVPPLRERPREIVVLAERFVAEISHGFGRRAPRIAAHAVALLESYAWPGNVRELRNVIQRAVVACEGDELRPEHLDLQSPLPTRLPAATKPPPVSTDMNLREVERKAIIDALTRSGGNQTRAAEVLGMPRRTLVHKLRALGIPRIRGGRA
ncbi:MAG: sigma 54-interacting transcriptional regulator [Deltaproteobacteria bacterium]